MARETGRRILARIYDQPSSPTHGHMPAAGSMARFAANFYPPLCARRNDWAFIMQPCVRTRRKNPRNLLVTFQASLIADECRPFDHRRRNYCPIERRTGRDEKPANGRRHKEHAAENSDAIFHGVRCFTSFVAFAPLTICSTSISEVSPPIGQPA